VRAESPAMAARQQLPLRRCCSRGAGGLLRQGMRSAFQVAQRVGLRHGDQRTPVTRACRHGLLNPSCWRLLTFRIRLRGAFRID